MDPDRTEPIGKMCVIGYEFDNMYSCISCILANLENINSNLKTLCESYIKSNEVNNDDLIYSILDDLYINYKIRSLSKNLNHVYIGWTLIADETILFYDELLKKLTTYNKFELGKNKQKVIKLIDY